MRRAMLFAAVVAAMAMGLTPARADRRVERPYQLGALGDVTMDCEGRYGGTCIEVMSDDAFADIRISDASGKPVGAKYAWMHLQMDVGVLGEYGVRTYYTLAEGRFCSAIEDRPKPPDTTHLFIWLDGPMNAEADCGPEGGVATDGTITVDFRPWPEDW